MLIKDHAKRHQNDKPPAVIVKALKLSPEDASALYVSDSQTYGNINDADASKHMQVVQVHYAHDKPSPAMNRFRGMAVVLNPLQPTLVKVVIKSYPYEDAIVGDEFPEQFGEEAKFSESRQGFVVRVAKPFSTVNISTHRKIDCSRSKFGNSIPMKDMFMQAAEKRGLNVEDLFKVRGDSLFCHVFFVSHTQMRLLPTENDDDDLIYLGSLKQQVADWADEDDDAVDEVVLQDMVPCDPGFAQLEALRPTYYSLSEAKELFGSGMPLVAWVKGKAPTRVVPTSYSEKERIRGNVPNLRLAWFKLLETGEQDKLREVLPESKHHLLDEYWAELMQMLDGKTTPNAEGVLEVRGPNNPTDGSLVAYLIECYFKLQKEADQADYLSKIGKATGPILRTMTSWAKPLTGLTIKQKTNKLARFLRRHLWHDVTSERLYTSITEFKRAMAPPVERAAMDSGKVAV
jgi:hypothetical protein